MSRDRPDLAPFCKCDDPRLMSRGREHIAPGWVEVWCCRCRATVVNHESWFERVNMEIENVTTTAQQPQQQPKPVDLGDMVTRGVGALPLDGILRVGVLCGMQGKLDPWLAFCRAEVARLSSGAENGAASMGSDVDAKIAAMVKEAVAKQGAAKRKPLKKKAPKKKAAKRKARK